MCPYTEVQVKMRVLFMAYHVLLMKSSMMSSNLQTSVWLLVLKLV